uniref:TIR domain-containing protein n=1 Tax=Clastoptera arizonana TaxID=38151 RepID=A0A1B6DXX9_9HEMI
MAGGREINLWDIPLYALRSSSRNYLASLLNCSKVLPSPNGLPRDWRGLADLSGVPTRTIRDNPTMSILSSWEELASSSLGQLYEFLGEMDRYDIQDDIEDTLYEDAEEYLRKMSSESNSDTILKNGDVDKNILTVDDVSRLGREGQLQYYDAFVLYADEDIDYANKIVDKLENEYHLKLCCKDRDLIGGTQFQHEAIMRLIAERCQRLVIVVTPNFLNSPANKFFVTFAQALGIEQRQRKVIPCIFENCHLPVELKYYFSLNYNRSSTHWNFWDKLRDSISVPNPVAALPFSKATVRELNTNEYESYKMLEAPSTKIDKTSELPSFSDSCKIIVDCGNQSTNNQSSEKNIHLSDLTISSKKVKSKKFFQKIFKSNNNSDKTKKKTPVLDHH